MVGIVGCNPASTVPIANITDGYNRWLKLTLLCKAKSTAEN